ncbi:MAG: hypothetical protein MHM6MM_002070 [Cercozoa sp. M6MM]
MQRVPKWQQCRRHVMRCMSASVGAETTTHFGFREIARDQKEELVAGVFHSVAGKYDLMNDVLSGGIHRYWKDVLLQRAGPVSGMRVLDVAGGTGDISFRMADRMQSGEVVVSDINPSMLQVGHERAHARAFRFGANILPFPLPEEAEADQSDKLQMKFVEANAEELPFEDNSFDLYTIAFGLRNVTNTDKALKEAHRVLRRGGRFLCLEFSQMECAPIASLYDWYSFNVLPEIGQVITGDREAYQYLAESIRQFHSKQRLVELMSEAGFHDSSYEKLTNGMVCIHSGFKL